MSQAANKKRHRYGLLLTIFLAALGIFLHYRGIALYPCTNFFQLYGDGYKNYFSVYYHVKHDSTYAHFGGMGYPYGDHIMFADGQPGVSNVLRFVSRNVVDISAYTNGIMNYLMLLSFVLGAVFLYLTFRKLQLGPWYSALVAVGIIMLSPQHFRTEAHYSLAYAFVLPSILYLLLCFEEKPTWRNSLKIGVFLGYVSLLHFYYFGIGGMLISFYFLFRFLRNLSWKNVLAHAGHYAIQVVIPFGLVQIWLNSTAEKLSDRPSIPYGFLDYHAIVEGIFASFKVPFWVWINKQKILPILAPPNTEAEAYIGLGAGLILAAFFLSKVLDLFLRKTTYPLPAFFQHLFPAIVLMLLLSLGLPFVFESCAWMIDYLGPFRQFRGQGRFAWAFYYGWNLMAWYLLYQFWQKKPRVLRSAWVVCLLLILSMDAYYISKASTLKLWQDYRMDQKEFEFSYEYWFKNQDWRRYQAVFPVPYHHTGSENFFRGADGDGLRFSTIPGWHYGLPTMGQELSRTSFSRSFKQLQLGYLPYQDYNIIEELPSKKPLLLILDPLQYGKTRQLERYLVAQGKPIYQDNLVSVMELPLSAFKQAATDWRKEQLDSVQKIQAVGLKKDQFWYKNPDIKWVYQSFDHQKSTFQYRGDGAFMATTAKEVPVCTFLAPAQNNTLTLWVYMGADQHPRINLKLYEISPSGEEKLVAHNASRLDLLALDNKGWGLVSIPLNVSQMGAQVRLALECKEIEQPFIFVDELFVSNHSSVLWDAGSYWVLDNFNVQK
jgi:hypothetical protein